MNIFEIAAINKFRFGSVKGQLTTEQLWDLPLRSTKADGFDLDNVAKAVNADLQEASETSFVGANTKEVALLTAKLDLVKHVIEAKKAEEDKRKKAVEKRRKREALYEALASKEADEIKAKSRDEILADLAAIDEDE